MHSPTGRARGHGGGRRRPLPEVRAPRLPGAVVQDVAVVRVPVPRFAVQPGRREEGRPGSAWPRPLPRRRRGRRSSSSTPAPSSWARRSAPNTTGQEPEGPHCAWWSLSRPLILAASSDSSIGCRVVLLVLTGGWASSSCTSSAVRAHATTPGGEVELAPNRKPYYDDDVLEGTRLDAVPRWAFVMLIIIAIGLPVYWLREPVRRQEPASTGAPSTSSTRPPSGARSCSSPRPATEPTPREPTSAAPTATVPEGVGGVASYVITDPAPGRPPNQVQWAAPALDTVVLRFRPDERAHDPRLRPANTPMPAWGVEGGGAMNEQQIDDLVEYLEHHVASRPPSRGQAEARWPGQVGSTADALRRLLRPLPHQGLLLRRARAGRRRCLRPATSPTAPPSGSSPTRQPCRVRRRRVGKHGVRVSAQALRRSGAVSSRVRMPYFGNDAHRRADPGDRRLRAGAVTARRACSPPLELGPQITGGLYRGPGRRHPARAASTCCWPPTPVPGSGFLLAAAGLVGWLVIMGIVWAVFGIGSGRPYPDLEGARGHHRRRSPSRPNVLRGLPRGFERLESSGNAELGRRPVGRRPGPASSAAPATRPGRRSVPEPAEFPPPFSNPTDYIQVAGFEHDPTTASGTFRKHKITSLGHDPHYLRGPGAAGGRAARRPVAAPPMPLADPASRSPPSSWSATSGPAPAPDRDHHRVAADLRHRLLLAAPTGQGDHGARAAATRTPARVRLLPHEG